MPTTATRKRALIVDETERYLEAGGQHHHGRMMASFVVVGSDGWDDPRRGKVLGEVELPADADLSCPSGSSQVQLPQTGGRNSRPIGGQDSYHDGLTWYAVGADKILDVATNPANASLGIEVIADYRAKSR